MIDVILFCLAWNVYFEARGEPYEGQLAVAEVTLNRADLSGRNICQEVFLDKQFSWSHQINRPKIVNQVAWQEAIDVSKVALSVPSNVSNGATHYHNGTVKPQWAKKLCKVVIIGRHIFYKPCP